MSKKRRKEIEDFTETKKGSKITNDKNGKDKPTRIYCTECSGTGVQNLYDPFQNKYRKITCSWCRGTGSHPVY